MGVHLLIADNRFPDEIRLLKISTSDWSIVDVQQPPFPKKNPVVLNSCNGLLCLRYPVDAHILWNPETDSFQKMPPNFNTKLHPCPACTDDETMARNNCRGYPDFHRLIALGFDAKSQDYKFVRFSTTVYKKYVDMHGELVRVEVYSLRHNSWKDATIPTTWKNKPYSRPGVSGAVCVNGCCYMDSRHGSIASFDFSSHKFSVIPCPEMDGDDFEVLLFELRGSLGLVAYPREGVAKVFRFWILAVPSSSWTRESSLDVRLFGVEMPLWFGKNGRNGESLLLRGVDGALLEYGYASRKMKRIGDDLVGKTRIHPYAETTHNLILTRIN